MRNLLPPGFFNATYILFLSAALSIACGPLHAQFLPPTQQTGIPDASGHRGGEDQSEEQKEMLAKLQIKRNEARQQQIVKDTSKLLALATELKSDVDKTNKDVLSLDVIRKADEIEKLSKNIKEHMKD